MRTIKDKAQIFAKNLEFRYGEYFYGVMPQSRLNPYRESINSNQAIFVHVPKSAGTSISIALFGETLGHSEAPPV